MVPITQSPPLSKRDIYPAGRRGGKAKLRFQPVPFPLLFLQLSRDKKVFEELGTSSQLEAHEPSWGQSRRGQAKCKKPYKMLPTATGLQHKEEKGQKGKQRQSKMMGFALVCPWPQWWALTTQEENGETTWCLQLMADLVVRVDTPMYRGKNMFWCYRILVTIILGF